jgi:hypothetical protein
MTPGTVFTTLFCLCNLRMGPISWNVTMPLARKAYLGQAPWLTEPIL